jgi:fructose-specific phosphotransferase system IIC component
MCAIYTNDVKSAVTSVKLAVLNTCSFCGGIIGGCVVGYLMKFFTWQKLFRSDVIRVGEVR